MFLSLNDMFFDWSPLLWHYVKDYLGILTLRAAYLEHFCFTNTSIIGEEFIIYFGRAN